MQILYRDEHLVVVLKPVGLLCHRDRSGAATVADRLPIPEARLVHRLDRPVSGLLVLALSRPAAGALRASFRRRQVEKEYLAVVRGTPQPSAGELVHHLFKRGTRSVVRDATDPRAQRAVLRYELLAERPPYSLLRLQPETGRHHQIRVQLSRAGHPILGDRKYRSRDSLKSGGIALFANALRLWHPEFPEMLAFRLEPPRVEPWTLFSSVLKS
ncbi:MAG: RNA pseudouridine synthase [Armatimonadetes bacterium]|nr:RNA pseudouridine synthase [Armatimonadota bacterium]